VKAKLSSSTPLWLRYYAILLGILFLGWIPIEDMNEGWVVAIAGAFTAWWAARYLSMSPSTLQLLWLRQAAAGLIAGLSVTPLSLILMVFKTGVHGHEAPDFTPQQMARVVELTPIWAGAGLLIGIGTSLWRMARAR
jgi:hypothetical protein